MDADTVRKLNQINRDFYITVSADFDKSRDYYWSGWEMIIPLISHLPDLQVLDIGCGNGRFGDFLLKKALGCEAKNYTGIDFNEDLLGKARYRLPEATLIKADLLEFDLASLEKTYDLIALFGVLHHIPSYANRLKLLKKSKQLLKPASYLFFSTWDFISMPNFTSHIVPWEDFGIPSASVEPNDHLLKWKRGVSAVRYCHYISEAEMRQLYYEADLIPISESTSSQKGDPYNRYYITSV